MTGADESKMVSDEELTAYLDGELDAASRSGIEVALRGNDDLRQRLARLEAGGRPFEASFVPLLETAPIARMEARIAELLPAASPSFARRHLLSRRPALAIAASTLLAFLAGFAADRAFQSFAPKETQLAASGGWRNAVADYLALYTAQSLALMQDDAKARAHELAGIAAALDLALAPDRLDIAGAAFKRAQLLQYEEKPLGQIAYLDPQYGPLAFCMIRNGRPDAPLRTEQRQGFNVVFWTEDGVGFMLIGRAPVDMLRPRAETLAARL